MRETLLKRIERLKQRAGGFSRNTMRWQMVYYNHKHISMIDFSSRSDEELLDLFQLIIRQHYKQM